MNVILPKEDKVVPLKVNIESKKDPEKLLKDEFIEDLICSIKDTEDTEDTEVVKEDAKEELSRVEEGVDPRYFCYILKNKVQPKKTYNGFTVDLSRRIRQHNSELVGGAKYTSMCGNRTWHYYAVLTGFTTSGSALSCEWWIKHPTGHRKRPMKYCGPRGRIFGLQLVLEKPRFKGYDPRLEYTLWIARSYLSCLNKSRLRPNIKVMSFEKIEDITSFYDPVVVDSPPGKVKETLIKERIQVKIVRRDELKMLEDNKCNVKP